ncbi:SDR family oxidoreductase [Legionella sp. km772]|uniref:SDR family oxidoreductase n=1 Tax=Legionella sp. km772 TaxID=2498111 RepID=UPI000F8DD0C9|nr:SDR family oxidoreductase [Legionella sp. km772]RUR08743.1 SDR family oxidoreductase [Legionella sp. km772]
MKIKDSVILITGGAKNLGLEMALYLHKQGAIVLVVDYDAKAVAQLPPEIKAYVLDITDSNKVQLLIKNLFEEHGSIQVLINNAGLIHSEPMINIMNVDNMAHSYQSFRHCLTANLDTAFIMSSAVVAQMVMKRTKGLIINMSSISAEGNEGQVAYSAAKAAINAMTLSLAKELGRFGIRCNAVAPGFIETESTYKALNPSIIKHIQDNTPLRRLGQAVEVAQAVTSLIENDFMNGVILPVNGGLTL